MAYDGTPLGASQQALPRHILIVEDEPDVMDAVQLLLEDEGYRVSTSRTGKEVEGLASAPELPDLILLDMLLSGRDGRDLVRLLKNQPKTQTVPVIMFSAHPTARADTLAAGADGFVPKPFQIEELLAEIDRLLP